MFEEWIKNGFCYTLVIAEKSKQKPFIMNKQVNRIDFTGQDIFCGLDVHKRQWKATACTAHVVKRTVTINPPFVPSLKKYLDTNFSGGNFLVAYEAGFSGFWAQKELESAGVRTLVVNPADIPTSDKDRKHKDDIRDSRKIATSLRSGELEGIYVPKDEALLFRSLVRERESITKSEQKIKNQIRCYLDFWGINIPEEMSKRNWSGRFIGWLHSIQDKRADLKLKFQLIRLTESRNLKSQILNEIRNIMKTPTYISTTKVLESVPGVGTVVSMVLLAEIADVHRFKNVDHLISYAGFIPTTRTSGDKEIVGTITNRKNKRINAVMIQAAWVAYKCDQELLAKYEGYRKRMGAQKAIVRIAKILLRRIYILWRRGELYRKSEV